MAKHKVLLAWLFVCGLIISSAGVALADNYPVNVAGTHYFVVGQALNAADGTLVNGKTVTLHPVGNPNFVLATSVVAGNKYVLNALANYLLPPGNYQVSIANDPFGYGVAPQNLAITGSGWDTGPDLQLAKGGQPFGDLQVTVTELGNPQTTIPGATVKVEGINNFSLSLNTDNAGLAAFNFLPVGDYKVTVTPPPNTLYAEQVYLAVRIEAGLTTNLSAELVKNIVPGTGALLGTVKDVTGVPIANAQVLINGTLFLGASGQDGKYLIPNVVPSVYQVEASKAPFSNTVIDGVNIEAGKSTSLDIYLTNPLQPGKASLIGHVRDSITGDLLANANVTLYGQAQATNPFGLYEHLNVAPGNAQALCQLINYQDQLAAITLQAGKTTQHDFAMGSNELLLHITTANLPEGVEDTLYGPQGQGFAIAAQGGQQPYTWLAENLPAGLVFGQNTGLISGKPAIGSAANPLNPYQVKITVTDKVGNQATKTLPLPIVSKDGAVPLFISKADTNNDGQLDAVKIAWATANPPDIYFLTGDGSGTFKKDPAAWSGPINFAGEPGFNIDVANKYILHTNQVGAGANNAEVYYKGLVQGKVKNDILPSAPAYGKINVAIKGAVAPLTGDFLGKNLNSIPLIPASSTINDVFGTGAPWQEGEMIQMKKAATPYYISAVYKAGNDNKWRDGGDTTKDPSIAFDAKVGYWIIAKSDKTLTFVGSVANENQLADEAIWGAVAANESGQTLLGLYHPVSVGLAATSLIANGALANDMIQYKKDPLNPAYISAVAVSVNGQLVWRDAANANNDPTADIATLKVPNSYIFSRIGGAEFIWHKGVQY